MTTLDRRKLMALAGSTAVATALADATRAQQGPPPAAPPGAAAPPRAPRPPYDPNGKIGEKIGQFRALDPEFNSLIADGAAVERIANVEGNAEGPTWVPLDGGYLLFSDPPMNRMWKWTAKTGATLFLEPSGFAGADARKIFREPGSNGIHYSKGAIYFADSGDRAIIKYDLKTKTRTTVVDKFMGKRLNSTNDLVFAKDGTIFFTDPPYGLLGVADSKEIELPYHGVYRLGTDGVLTLVDTSPLINGIALSPDDKILYTCGGRAKRAQFDVGDGRIVNNKRDFGDNETGGDGMKVDAKGYLWCSGGPGLIIFNPAGKRIGVMEANTGCANCTFGADGTLYLAMGHSFGRAKTKTKGIAW
jgi:gluconolactonase